MAKTVQMIIDRASATLNDIGLVRWIESDMIKAIDDAQQAVLEARPDLFETDATITLAAGPKQTPPADGYKLIDVIYNVNDSGTPIATITKIKRSDLDKCRGDWMLDDPCKVADHWMQAPKEKLTFFVYPPQPSIGSRGKVLLRYAKRPTTLTAAGDSLGVPDEMVNAVYYFTVMRMLERDEKFSGSPQAERFMSMFGNVMGVKSEADNRDEAQRAGDE